MRGGKPEQLQPWTTSSLTGKGQGGDVLTVARSGASLSFGLNGKQLGMLQIKPEGGPCLGIMMIGAGEISSDYIALYLELRYQGEALQPPADKLQFFSERFAEKATVWPIGKLEGGTKAAPEGPAYVMRHEGRDGHQAGLPGRPALQRGSGRRQPQRSRGDEGQHFQDDRGRGASSTRRATGR